jgi:hypothetical protein
MLNEDSWNYESRKGILSEDEIRENSHNPTKLTAWKGLVRVI